jgi:hypothetical protein
MNRRFPGANIEEDDDPGTGTVRTLRSKKFGRQRIVWVRHLSMSPEHLGTLMHELFHLVVRVCRDKGVPIVANIQNGAVGDEAASYLFDFYARCSIEEIKRKSK